MASKSGNVRICIGWRRACSQQRKHSVNAGLSERSRVRKGYRYRDGFLVAELAGLAEWPGQWHE